MEKKIETVLENILDLGEYYCDDALHHLRNGDEHNLKHHKKKRKRALTIIAVNVYPIKA